MLQPPMIGTPRLTEAATRKGNETTRLAGNRQESACQSKWAKNLGTISHYSVPLPAKAYSHVGEREKDRRERLLNLKHKHSVTMDDGRRCHTDASAVGRCCSRLQQ
jgi:hypothetical protein